jgi:hypothetical protein
MVAYAAVNLTGNQLTIDLLNVLLLTSICMYTSYSGQSVMHVANNFLV